MFCDLHARHFWCRRDDCWGLNGDWNFLMMLMWQHLTEPAYRAK